MLKITNNLVWLLFFILSVVAVFIVYTNIDNFFLRDQFELAAVLVQEKNLFSIFNFEYGPHRQGLAFVVWWFFQNIIGIDARIPVWISVTFIISATYLAIVTSRRLATASIIDILIPYFFISPKLHESVIGVSNPSHGPFPLFLIFFMVFILSKRDSFHKNIFLGISVFLMTFSGFGMVVLPAALLYSLIPTLKLIISNNKTVTLELKNMSENRIILLFAIIISFLLFIKNYALNSAASCFNGEFNILPQIEYAVSILGHSIGFTEAGVTTLIFGLVFFVSLLVIFFLALKMLLFNKFHSEKEQHFAEAILFTSGFTIVFILVTAYGRECLGIETAFASRYLVYVLPGFWALLLFLKKNYRRLNFRKDIKMYLVIFFITLNIYFGWRGNKTWMLWIDEWQFTRVEILKCTNKDPNLIVYCQDKLNLFIFPDSTRLKQLIREIYE